MSNLSFFEFRSNQVRTAMIDGEIVFCLGDVLAAMGTSMTVYQAKAGGG